MIYCNREIKYTVKGCNTLRLRNEDRHPQIGDVYLMNFGGQGNEQKGWRPGLVFQNNLGNQHSPNIIALPLTSSLKKSNQPTHVVVPANGTGLVRDSMVLCENPERMSKEKLGNYLTTIPKEYMAKIAVANLLATSAISFIEPDLLLAVWQKSLVLNEVVV